MAVMPSPLQRTKKLISTNNQTPIIPGATKAVIAAPPARPALRSKFPIASFTNPGPDSNPCLNPQTLALYKTQQ